MSKPVESIIITRLMWDLEIHNPLSLHQFGLHENRSTIDPLTTIHVNICDALKKKKISVNSYYILYNI